MEQAISVSRNDFRSSINENYHSGTVPMNENYQNGSENAQIESVAFIRYFGEKLFHYPSLYTAFVEIVKALDVQIIDFPGFIERVHILLNDFPELLLELNTLLPSSYQFLPSSAENKGPQFATPTGSVSRPYSYAASYADVPSCYHRAIAYIAKVKKSLKNSGTSFQQFQLLLQQFSSSQISLEELQSRLTSLLSDFPALSQQFQQFLPNSVFYSSTPPLGSYPIRTVQSSNFRLSNLSDFYPPPSSAHGTVSTVFPSVSQPDAIDFFKHVKHQLPSLDIYHEFLKLINLYVQKIISRDTLLARSFAFLRSLPDLWKSFQLMLHFNPQEFPNIYYTATSDHSDYGPSYRLLPLEERMIPCSGRDELAWSILNDEWVSHPTWASEESGFIVQRKTPYEDAMTKLEEERYEFDRHIEAINWTIKALKNLADRLGEMPDDERNSYQLPPGLGLQSKSIYEKTIKLVYTADHYKVVLNALESMPSATLPIVLKRLIEKKEEWQSAKESLQPIWRNTEFKNYDKSLDPQCIYFKAKDRKVVTPKLLLAEAETIRAQTSTKFPFLSETSFDFSTIYDNEHILFDVCYIVCTYVVCNSPSGLKKVENFFKSTLPLFFGIDKEKLAKFLDPVFHGPNYDSSVDNTSGSKIVRRKRSNSITQLTELSKHQKISDQRQSRSAAAAKKKGDVTSNALNYDDAPSDNGSSASSSKQQLSRPAAAIVASLKYPSHPDHCLLEGRNSEKAVPDNQTAQEEKFPFMKSDIVNEIEQYGYSAIYVFFRLFNMLYERLLLLKNLENCVADAQKQIKPNPVAQEHKLWRNRESELPELPEESTYYDKTFVMSLRLIYGVLDQNQFEDYIRFYYGNKAYELYTVDKLVWSIAKQVHHIVSDGKFKHVLSVIEEYNSQSTPKRSYDEFLYRMNLERYLNPDEMLFRFSWNFDVKRFTINLLRRANVTIDETLESQRQGWKKYLEDYIDQKETDCVSYRHYRCPFLCRTIPFGGTSGMARLSLQKRLMCSLNFQSDLKARLCINSFKLLYVPCTQDAYSSRVYLKLNNSESQNIQLTRCSRWKARLSTLQNKLFDGQPDDVSFESLFI
ncbi:Clr6 histone deacetylase complex subunit Pst2 [Schizosaccharomyces cryophilus OY26]|uniref:Clr6 histone deacetylase complex subunit Pst2 n=1 Tax=Schizosaccharomyces cryophilus (strain OY26 / ATCC MYA-4695 / CBS 11777 / NBRC 106824 / NRRL Y48691) TaxID=653667 RepID=S9VZR3_SCHCR|nr:Clr6 histone deacetylase complex subunit Pst2 [Schizosaccharomyces cryophilus OY26]EPY51759.1 Clr6 histone deacetylase complex subunit Pst2 [Schizosaccharomyces cryophilus OY26]